MNYLVLGVAVAVIGVVLGRALVGRAVSGAANPEQAVRRRQTVQLVFIAIGAAFLTFDAVHTERHRWLNVAVVAIMIGGVVFDWIRARRRRRLPEPQPQHDDQ